MSILLKQLIITDVVEKSSKKIMFSDGINLITSVNNSMGKSIIMKSIYHTLGANCDFDDIFTEKNVLFDIVFEHNSSIFRVVRYKNSYRIFKNGQLLKTVKSGNINELSEFFKDEIGTYVYLKNRTKTTELAPPAFLFIPYYLDQDLSWKKIQYPFNNIGQYESMSLNELYYYHLGVYTEEYNKNKSEQLALKKEQGILEKKAEKENLLFAELKKSLGSESIAINETEFQALLTSYSKVMKDLLFALDKKRKSISFLEKEKIEYLIEEKRIDATIKKIKDNKIDTIKTLQCPVCQNEIEIDLEKELGLIYDVKILKQRLEAIDKLIDEIEEKISSENKERNEIEENIFNYEKEVFENRKLLNEYLNRKATEKLLAQKSIEVSEYTVQMNKLREDLTNLRNAAKVYKDKTDSVNSSFIENYKTELYELQTPEFNPNLIKPFQKAKISGSQYVRSTLAFYYSFIRTKEDIGVNDFLFPMVIDSPREGEQDDLNSTAILKFIFDNKIPNYQLVVATVNAERYIEIPENVSLIKIEGDQRRVMSKKEYLENQNEIDGVFSYFKRQKL